MAWNSDVDLIISIRFYRVCLLQTEHLLNKTAIFECHFNSASISFRVSAVNNRIDRIMQQCVLHTKKNAYKSPSKWNGGRGKWKKNDLPGQINDRSNKYIRFQYNERYRTNREWCFALFSSENALHWFVLEQSDWICKLHNIVESWSFPLN